MGILSQCLGISNHNVHFKCLIILHVNYTLAKLKLKKGIIENIYLELDVHSGSGGCRNWHMPMCQSSWCEPERRGSKAEPLPLGSLVDLHSLARQEHGSPRYSLCQEECCGTLSG